MKSIIFFLVVFLIIANVLKALWNQTNASSGKRRKRSLFEMLASQKRNQVWMDSASELEMEYMRPDENGFPALRGIRDGHSVEVEIEQAGQVHVTQCTVYFKEAFRFGIRLFRGRSMNPGMIGSTEDELAQAGLVSDSEDRQKLQFFLTEKRRKNLLNALNSYHFLSLTDEYVSLKMDGICIEAEQLKSLIGFTLSLAKSLEDPEKHQTVMPVRKLSKFATPSIPRTPVPPRRTEQKKPEMTVIREQPKPESPPLEQDKTVIRTHCRSFGAQELAEKLFSKSFPGQEEQEFFKTVKGSEVEWDGTLISVYRFGSDYVLGNGPAVKAVFETAEISGAYSMKTRIKTLVRLPEGSLEDLHNHNGKIFRFRGTLEKFEPFAKEIILLNGTLK